MIKDQRDFWAGLLFIALGAFFSLYSIENYSLGTAARMGPGYFPMLLGGFLAALGLLITLKSFVIRDADGGKIGHFDWRSASIILGSVGIFALLLRPGGLIAASAVMVFLSTFGNRADFSWKRSVSLCLVLSAIVWLIFVKGLGLVVPIWPAFI